MTLSEYVKAYRAEHELSVREFARQAKMSATHVTNIERGLNNEGKPLSPTMDSYAKIAAATGKTIDDLFIELSDVVEINGLISNTEYAMVQLYRKASKEVRETIDILLSRYDI